MVAKKTFIPFFAYKAKGYSGMIQKIPSQNLGLPSISIPAELDHDYELFDLSSHARAREALEFGLNISKPDFHIFVIGENRSGRLSATLKLVKKYLEKKPPHSE